MPALVRGELQAARAAFWIVWGHFGALAVAVPLAIAAGAPIPAPWGVAAIALAYVAALAPTTLRRREGSDAYRVVLSAALGLDAIAVGFVARWPIEGPFHALLVVAFVTVFADARLPWIAAGVALAGHSFVNVASPAGVLGGSAADGLLLVDLVAIVAGAGVATLVVRAHRRSLASESDARTLLAEEMRAHRRLAEEVAGERRRLEAVLDHMPAGVILAEAPSGRFLHVNAEVARILRYPFKAHGGLAQYPSFAGFRPDGAIVPPEGWPLSRSLSNGEVVLDEEIRVQRADGTLAVLSVHSAPVRNASGSIEAAVMILVDRTDAKEAERKLEVSRRSLRMAEQVSGLRVLVGGLAHEIRTPLTYISNNVWLLRRRLETEAKDDPRLATVAADAKRLAVEAQDGIARIEHLVRNLRQVTRVEPGVRAVSRLHEVVEAAVDLFRATHRASHVIETGFGPTPEVEVDRGQVQQVVLNLLANAADAQPSGGVIRVATRTVPGGAEISVADRGSGIPPELRARLFDPFFTTKPEGTGLGLSISKQIVEAHGGALTFETVLAQGTTFRAVLPARSPQPRPTIEPAGRGTWPGQRPLDPGPIVVGKPGS